MSPLWLFVQSALCKGAQRSHHAAIDADLGGRELGAGRLVHERHELVRKARHGATDANAPDVGAAADAGHPAALAHVAIHDRTPAAALDDALGRAVFGGEIALLVVAGAIAALVYGLAEQPGRSQLLIKRDHRREPRRLVEQVKK